jgi:hypothetical protein
MVGVENDAITAGIAAALYPSAVLDVVAGYAGLDEAAHEVAHVEPTRCTLTRASVRSYSTAKAARPGPARRSEARRRVRTDRDELLPQPWKNRREIERARAFVMCRPGAP